MSERTPAIGDPLLGTISRLLAWLAGGIILFGCALPISIDVLSRLLLNRTLVESFEISGYALAACIGLGLGYTVTTKANVRIDFLTAKLPWRLRMAADLLAALALALLALALAWFAWGVLQQSWSQDARSLSTLRVPLYLPQGLWWIGLFWFACVALLSPLIAILRLLRGESREAEGLLSSAALTEEIEQAGLEGRDGRS